MPLTPSSCPLSHYPGPDESEVMAFSGQTWRLSAVQAVTPSPLASTHCQEGGEKSEVKDIKRADFINVNLDL